MATRLQRSTKPQSDTTATVPLDPYVRFVGIILQRAVLDASGRTTTNRCLGDKERLKVIAEARQFLMDTERLEWFCALTGAEVRKVQLRLLQEIGSQEET